MSLPLAFCFVKVTIPQNKAMRGKINEFNGELRQPRGRPKTLSNSGEGKTAEQSHSTKTQQIQCGRHAGAQRPLAAPFWQNVTAQVWVSSDLEFPQQDFGLLHEGGNEVPALLSRG